MARYTGPKVRITRRLSTNIFENEKGRKALDRRPFPPGAALRSLNAWLGGTRTPFNAASLWAVACLVAVWLLVYHSRWGYKLRVLGASADAARYAGMDPARLTMQAMLLSGALAGGVALRRGSDTLNGGRLTIDLNTGLSSVDGGGGTRVDPVTGTLRRA